jgi:hypothetical protein
VVNKGKRTACACCGERYSRRRLRCPNCGEENTSLRDGIPEEELVPSPRVRLRALVWIASGLVLVPLLVWLYAQSPAGEPRREETVLWTPFFRIVRAWGKEQPTHPAGVALAILAIVAVVVSGKGWGELLTGLRYGLVVRLNPARGWPEAKNWLLLLASIAITVAIPVGLFLGLWRLFC